MTECPGQVRRYDRASGQSACVTCGAILPLSPMEPALRKGADPYDVEYAAPPHPAPIGFYLTNGDSFSDPPRASVCGLCGALVGDEDRHTRWHRQG